MWCFCLSFYCILEYHCMLWIWAKKEKRNTDPGQQQLHPSMCVWVRCVFSDHVLRSDGMSRSLSCPDLMPVSVRTVNKSKRSCQLSQRVRRRGGSQTSWEMVHQLLSVISLLSACAAVRNVTRGWGGRGGSSSVRDSRLLHLHLHRHTGNWTHVPPSVGESGAQRGPGPAASSPGPSPSDSRAALHEVRRSHNETREHITDPRAAALSKHRNRSWFLIRSAVVTRGAENFNTHLNDYI